MYSTVQYTLSTNNVSVDHCPWMSRTFRPFEDYTSTLDNFLLQVHPLQRSRSRKCYIYVCHRIISKLGIPFAGTFVDSVAIMDTLVLCKDNWNILNWLWVIGENFTFLLTSPWSLLCPQYLVKIAYWKSMTLLTMSKKAPKNHFRANLNSFNHSCTVFTVGLAIHP